MGSGRVHVRHWLRHRAGPLPLSIVRVLTRMSMYMCFKAQVRVYVFEGTCPCIHAAIASKQVKCHSLTRMSMNMCFKAHIHVYMQRLRRSKSTSFRKEVIQVDVSSDRRGRRGMWLRVDMQTDLIYVARTHHDVLFMCHNLSMIL